MLWTRLRRWGWATTADSVRKHDDGADEQSLPYGGRWNTSGWSSRHKQQPPTHSSRIRRLTVEPSVTTVEVIPMTRTDRPPPRLEHSATGGEHGF